MHDWRPLELPPDVNDFPPFEVRLFIIQLSKVTRGARGNATPRWAGARRHRRGRAICGWAACMGESKTLRRNGRVLTGAAAVYRRRPLVMHGRARARPLAASQSLLVHLATLTHADPGGRRNARCWASCVYIPVPIPRIAGDTTRRPLSLCLPSTKVTDTHPGLRTPLHLSTVAPLPLTSQAKPGPAAAHSSKCGRASEWTSPRRTITVTGCLLLSLSPPSLVCSRVSRAPRQPHTRRCPALPALPDANLLGRSTIHSVTRSHPSKLPTTSTNSITRTRASPHTITHSNTVYMLSARIY
ncbi:hypothetical protein C8Q73DRAFT_236742 [Cubamyces lactineus]|nr:hypothetical protein C8Q73DRAFT_236742 [Cubamyces lactineus]